MCIRDSCDILRNSFPQNPSLEAPAEADCWTKRTGAFIPPIPTPGRNTWGSWIFRILLQGPGGLNKHTGWLIGCPRLVWRGNLQGFGLVDYIFRSAWCSFYSILQVFQLKKPLLIFLNVIHQPNFTFEHGFGAPIFFWIQEKYKNTKKSSGPAALYRIFK